MDKLKLSIKPQAIIIFVAVLVVGLATYFLAIPQAGKLKINSTELTAKKAEAARLEERKNSLINLTTKLPSYAADIERLSLAYPKEDQVVEALIQAQTMIERAGVTINNLAPAQGEPGSLKVGMVLKGSYAALINLLHEFERNLRPVVVRQLTTTSGEKEAGVLTLLVTTTFEYNGAKPTPAPTAQATTEVEAAGQGESGSKLPKF